MQTFLPYSDYEASAQTLDNKRLNKQILEGYQILKVLSGASPSGAWRNHPAVLMWKNSENELLNYVEHMIYEADWRGIKVINNRRNILELKNSYGKSWGNSIPTWMNDNSKLMRLTTTHKANLYIKDPVHYIGFKNEVDSSYNVPCCDKCKYYWVTHEEKNGRK
jgi:Pyrimidine dimer DNA glycosylase